MSLAPGSRLGAYEILSLLGAGGMGEVYRARDTNLNRDVALKILLTEVADNPERLARFRREAQILASLNHPNIAHIHGLEETGGTVALILEIVEGETLADRIARGPIPLDEALPIAKQIAEALEAAHEHGIIHRDLKPTNIKVRDDGTVKVLDFGLAKAMEPSLGSPPSVTQSPTITQPTMTQAGIVLGTAAYMSPEQACGKTVDKRTDIWSFGAVLFELLTGKRAFAGDDVSEVMASVLAREPDWTQLTGRVPSTLGFFLRRCLQKDLNQRVRAIGDVGLALESTTDASTTLNATPRPEVGSRLWWFALVAVAAVVGLSVPAVRHLRETPTMAPAELRTDLVTPPSDQPAAFALSPDGEQLAFVASENGVSRVWVRSLATAKSQPLAGTEGATYPFWAPDGRAVGFFANGSLKRVDVAGDGGAPRILAAAPVARGGTWNADGVILFAPTGTSPLVRVPATGGPYARRAAADGRDPAAHSNVP